MTKHSLDTPQFYLTAPGPCPYLPDMQERKVFTHLVGEKAIRVNDMLTQGGFRRSQNIAYRPACEHCRACISVRVCVDRFKPTRSQKRILSKNRDLEGVAMPTAPSAEQYALFKEYLHQRHPTGGMVAMTSLDYAMMVEDTHVHTEIIEYRPRQPYGDSDKNMAGPLVACALTDRLADGLSMVYSFYDEELKSQSLGAFMILDHIARARKLGLPYVYLGYWVADSPKMSYKTAFLPQQHLGMSGWEDFRPEEYPDH